MKPDLTEQLFDTIWQLKKLTSQVAYKTHEEKLATMLQFSALSFLKVQSGTTVGDLAGYLQLSKSSATQLTERLVKVGFVKRDSDKIDHRIIHLVLTPKGEDELIAIKQKTMDNMRKFLSKISKKDIQELIRIHNNLITVIKKETI